MLLTLQENEPGYFLGDGKVVDVSSEKIGQS